MPQRCFGGTVVLPKAFTWKHCAQLEPLLIDDYLRTFLVVAISWNILGASFPLQAI